MDKVELTKIEQIKNLYSQIEKKVKFIEFVAEKVERSPKTLRNHWFAEFWSVPVEHQEQVIKLLKETISKQKELVA
jgi:hypothetical protein